MELIGRGRTADVFALDTRTVLRRYRDGQDVAAEAALMRHLERHGYPMPRVLDANGCAVGLADLHRRLRRVPVPDQDPAPGTSVVHLDLHPGNVVLDRHRDRW